MASRTFWGQYFIMQKRNVPRKRVSSSMLLRCLVIFSQLKCQREISPLLDNGRSSVAGYADSSVFRFDVNSDCLEETLDRFARLFIKKPEMSPDAIMGEVKSVESEYQKKSLSDSERMNRLHHHLSSKSHPLHKFTGNAKTLEAMPKERIRDALLEFYEAYYSANLMCLVVYAKENLDKIQGLVENNFLKIRNTNRPCPIFKDPPCEEEHLQILVKAVPLTQGHIMRILWPITPGMRYLREGPSMYLSYLIGKEGKGSLLHVLETLGWATWLYAAEEPWNDFSFFEVIIYMTDAGHEHGKDILKLLFKYIRLLQQSDPCKEIFDELSGFCEMAFHYQDKISPFDYVSKIASNMQLFPPDYWLAGKSLPSTFGPDIIQQVLNELTPKNVRIFWLSKKFEETDMSEPWYGTPYSIKKLSDSEIKHWMESALDERLRLPAPNAFIPPNFSRKTDQETSVLPFLLRSRESRGEICHPHHIRLWYKPDTMFFTPKADVKIDFNCPYARSSPEATILNSIFTKLLVNDLIKYADYARVAGLSYAINDTGNGFQVNVHGFNHKLRTFLEIMVKKIAKFEVRDEKFHLIKEMVTNQGKNIKSQQPYDQALDYWSLILIDRSWHWNDLLKVLSRLEADNVAKFVHQLLSRTFIECYISGNIARDEAVSIIQYIEDVFFTGSQPISEAVFSSELSTNRVTNLQRGISYFYPVKGLNSSDEISALVHYIQVHRDDFMLNVKLQFFTLMINEPFIRQLGSEEQVGYTVMSMLRIDSAIYGVQFIVQSIRRGLSPGHMNLRVVEFLKWIESKIYKMSGDEFEKRVDSLIRAKLRKPQNLMEESLIYWKEIVDGTLKFDRREREVAALKQLTKEDFIAFFDEYIKVGAPRKKTLSVQVYGTVHSSEYKKDKNEQTEANVVRIDDIFDFKRSQPLYGSFKGRMQL
ncbi:insulin-degrading enzyme-like 1, peroxisomal isoform X4 [Actinidia eriantha]|uniref:insulin-degrading enzyme-like 1, peroxisomal isoform X4 n=1 Tax=Actinidia eriantha TaxID=165200 RepID=UPI002583EFA1|nr:insulin-degrading enzyme-like 1, peroxisomal isoform X4 [Actinidia eriantha]